MSDKNQGFEISFRIFHPSMDAEKISTELRMTPTFCYTAGDQRKTPKGVPLPGKNKRTYWFLKMAKEHIDDIAFVSKEISNFNEKLASKKVFLEAIRQDGGKIEYFIGLFVSQNLGGVIEWETLGDCARLKIDICFDVYGGENLPDQNK